MMNGASVLEGYVPDIDASVVTRILDAGGEIAGKAVCEYYCVSGTSSTSATGPVHNPHKRGYSAGGSSSGSAAVVAAGDVEMALGGDQAGSIRIPSSYCGTYGMKGTFGLVPYTGIIPLEITIDHCGPISNTVYNNALLMEVLAGPDGLDSRGRTAFRSPSTPKRLRKTPRVCASAWSPKASGTTTPSPTSTPRCARARSVSRGSAPRSPRSRSPCTAWRPRSGSRSGTTRGFMTMMAMNGAGVNHQGLYVTSLLDAASGWRTRSDEMADTIKIIAMFGHHSLRHHRGHYYAKAMNLRRRLRAAYDAALADCDLLLMPTLPMKASKLPSADAGPEDVTRVAWEMLANTSAFNITGHPAMTMPCGLSEELPIGLMLVGRHWEEGTIYRAAHAFEQLGDWRGF